MSRRAHTSLANLALRNNVLAVSGSVRLTNARALRSEGERLLAEVDEIDFSQAQCHDSSALLLILAWQRFAKTINKSIRLRGIPEQLFAVAEVYGIKDLIR